MSMIRPRKNRGGQALVEFALIAPILLLIVVGIIQFGHAWNAYQALVDMGREAARLAVVENTVRKDSVHNMVNSRLVGASLDSTTESLTFPLGFSCRPAPAATNPCIDSGETMVVQLSYPYRMGWLQPFLNWTTGQASITLKTTTSMRQE